MTVLHGSNYFDLSPRTVGGHIGAGADLNEMNTFIVR